MDTSDAWIRPRSGIAQRHFASEGQGASDLALPAALQALEAAKLRPVDVDYILFNTMTPDYAFPGSGALLGDKLKIPGVPALDLRQQCAAIPFSLQVADALVGAGAARNVLLVCAEAHAGMMPWKDWDALHGDASVRPSAEDFTNATKHRGFSVLFGDGAGALVVGRSETSKGLLGVRVHTDGRHHDAMRLSAGGFRNRPFLSARTFENEEYVPRMDGRELFRSAVHKLPEVIREVLAAHDLATDDVDWFIAHQANDRINKAVREALELPDDKVPSNIERYGNTSSATIPILFDELVRDGRLRRGQLVCFFALGAGLNWGAALMRV